MKINMTVNSSGYVCHNCGMWVPPGCAHACSCDATVPDFQLVIPSDNVQEQLDYISNTIDKIENHLAASSLNKNMIDLLLEIAKEPYSDSDLKSLLQTFRIQAKNILWLANIDYKKE